MRKTNETNPGATASVVPVSFDSGKGYPARSAVGIKTKFLYRSREKRKQEEGENTKTKKKPKGGGTVAFV